MQQLASVTDPASLPQALTRVVICGEVNAGKSTVINALLRRRALPDNIGEQVRPVVQIVPADRSIVVIERPDGALDSADSQCPADSLRGAARVTIHDASPHLADFEIVELPVTTADDVTQADRALMASADVLVWVTIASQAWRLTEKSILARFEETLPQNRVLVITRGDKLRSETDRKKLLMRVRRETDGLFQDWLFLNGSNTILKGSESSDADWQHSGAPAIMTRLTEWHEAATGDAVDVSDRSAIENLVDLATYQTAPASTTPPPEAPADATLPDLTPDVEPEAAAETVFPALPQEPSARDSALLAALIPFRDRFPDGTLIGTNSPLRSRSVQVVAGDDDRGHALACAMQAAMARVHQAYVRHGLEAPVSSLMLNATEHRIGCDVLSDGTLVFALTDADQVNAGTMKSTMERMSEAARATL